MSSQNGRRKTRERTSKEAVEKLPCSTWMFSFARSLARIDFESIMFTSLLRIKHRSYFYRSQPLPQKNVPPTDFLLKRYHAALSFPVCLLSGIHLTRPTDTMRRQYFK